MGVRYHLTRSVESDVPDAAASEQEKLRRRMLEQIVQTLGDEMDTATPIPGLTFHRTTTPGIPRSYVLEPSICVIVQGVKQVILGDEEYVYDENNFLVTALDLPLISQVLEASEERPCLSMTLRLDQKAIAQLIMDEQVPANAMKGTQRCMAVDSLGISLLRALCRLLDLDKEPESIAALAPIFHKEILYRLMQTEPGPRIRQIGAAGSHTRQISGAINWIKDNLSERLSVEELASRAGMSSSTLHQHFKSLTALSPLQFQKRLRLSEARRLMLVDKVDAATASFQVGYESPSQFSREYSRLFGAPPMQDIRKVSNLIAS